ncbi:MAG: 4a-hydroxytetrahydrobiopterin dehydratase [Vampirovibrio sp.]|nr:4a-hydroxytetrahydrobiopterin dehydratase [Vampirovibrio sp.]
MVPPLKLADEELKKCLADLPCWTIEENALQRMVDGKTYPASLDLLMQVGQLAETENHHPDMMLHYKRLTIRFWTHTAGGVTELDVAMAQKTEALIQGYI